MSSVKISAMPSASTLLDANLGVVVQSGTTKQCTMDQVGDYIETRANTFSVVQTFSDDITITAGKKIISSASIYNSIDLDSSGDTFWKSRSNITLDVDSDNNQTTKSFRVRKDSATDLLKIYESGVLELHETGAIQIGTDLTGGASCILELGSSAQTGGVSGFDLHFGNVSAEDYNIRILNNNDLELNIVPVTYAGSVLDLDFQTIDAGGDMVFIGGKGMKSGTGAGDTMVFGAYDVDGTAYTTLMRLTSNNTPTLELVGQDVKIGSGIQLVSNVSANSSIQLNNGSGNMAFSSDGLAQMRANDTIYMDIDYNNSSTTEEFIIRTNAGASNLFKMNEAGIMSVGTHTAIGAETVTGYITINDIGGTTRKVAIVS